MRRKPGSRAGLAGLGTLIAAAAGAAGLGAQEAATPGTARMTAALEAAREELVAIRRDIHRHPEPSGEEERTAALVARRLRSLGLEVETGVGGHGVVGVLRGRAAGPVVAYRADMDAVRDPAPDPVPFRSEVPGVRHICGHDIHTTVALGVAEALAAVRDELPGTVKFIFQSSEENIRGARAMIADGALEDPVPGAIFAVHTAPLEVGRIGYVEGLGLPGFDVVTVTVSGGDDAGGVARAISDLISNVSTVGPPGSGTPVGDDFIWATAFATRDPGGTGWLVRGTVKASGDEAYARARVRITDGVADLATHGLRADLDYRDRVLPDMVNDAGLVRASLAPLGRVLGADNVIDSGPSPYFGEDFAFFQQIVPGAMYWLGVSNSEEGTVGMPHSPGYVADEEAIFVGARAMAAVLIEALHNSM